LAVTRFSRTLSRYRGDTGEIQGRNRGDTGEIQGRYRGDTGEIQGRYRGDTGEVTRFSRMLSRSPSFCRPGEG
jgi:hypothetical protein